MKKNKLNLLFAALGCLFAVSMAFSEPLFAQYSPSEAELEIWNDPSFKKQLAYSYAPVTEIEPKVNEDEHKELIKIFELITSYNPDEKPETADNLDDAAAKLKKEIDRNPAVSAVFHFTLANIYFQKDELEEAAPYYQAAIKKEPQFRRAQKNLGLIRLRQEKYKESLSALTKVIELGGGDALTYGMLGFAYSSVDDSLAAESAFRMAILLDSNTRDWKMGLARSFFMQERFSEAVAICGLLIKEEPDCADYWLLQANAYLRLKKPLKAAENYEFVNHLGKSTVDSLNMLGDIYVNQELYEMAVKNYLDAMKNDPGIKNDSEKKFKEKIERAIRNTKVLAARGAYKETRQLIEYLEAQFADRLDNQTHIDLLKLQARLAVANGSEDDEEVRILKEIVELDHQDGEALILLGQHSARNGDNAMAVIYYKQAANIKEYEADANIRHAELLVSERKYDQALPLLKQAQLLKPRDSVQEYLEQIERFAKNR